MNVTVVRERLAAFPRVNWSHLPTPLEPLPRLSAGLNGPELWIKRDDGYGPGSGGNKGRTLGYLLGDVRRRKVVTFGGVQSNHVRMTAAACAALDLESHIFFFGRRPESLSGNLLLDDLLGARLHFIPFGGGGDGSMTLETTNRLVRVLSLAFVGPGALFVPVGGHCVAGALGYVEAACEIHEQVVAAQLPAERVSIVVPVGTGGTFAGLLVGMTLIGSPIRVLGLDIGKLWKQFSRSVAQLATNLSAALGQPRAYAADNLPLIEGIYAGAGYAQPRPSTADAIRQLAQTEGILLDPVYTGKAFAGLLDLVSKERFGNNDIVIFLHTGGIPALWSYTSLLA